jgi:hypothetical protein
MRRRDWIVWAGVSAVCSRSRAGAPLRIAAAWQRGGLHQVGVLRREAERLVVECAQDLPSRPHGVRVEADGSILVVARRPGDWLLRWSPARGNVAWQWAEPDRSYNGHVLTSLDGSLLYTTETDTESSGALLGVRDAATLCKLAEWKTHGTDAHDLVHDGEAGIIVANGGVTAAQETGRLKLQLDRMDSSLVRLGVRDGELLGQWRLADPRLSLRHLAWSRDGDRRVLGVSMQAEHATLSERAVAPLLARFDGKGLSCCAAPEDMALAGYGGDIVGTRDGFMIGCTRAGRLAAWSADGRWRWAHALPQACAVLAATGDGGMPVIWAAGATVAQGDGRLALPDNPPMRLDNHWAWLPPSGQASYNLVMKEWP